MRTFLVAAAFALLSAVLLAGCTVLSDFGFHQCTADEDCTSIDGPTQRCEQSRCVSGCADNHQCTSIDPRLPICQSRGGQCVGLTTEGGECYLSTEYSDPVMGALTADRMILLGAFAPSLKSSTWLTSELAIGEINSVGGMPTPDGRYPLLLVLCDDAATSMPKAMDHLTSKLRVRSIVASLEYDALRASLALPQAAGALFLSPGTQYLSPPDVGAEAPFLWYLGADYRILTGPYSALLGVASNGLQSKIAFVIGSSVEDGTLADGVEAEIERIAGLDAEQLFQANRYRRFNLPGGDSAARDQFVQKIVAFAPDVVAVFGGEAADEIADKEPFTTINGLNQAATAQWRPYFIFGPRNIDDANLLKLAANDPDFRQRAIGVRAYQPVTARLAAALTARFLSAFPFASEASGIAVSLETYDAIYFLAYAAAMASPGAPLSPDETLGGLARIADTTAMPVDVGPDGLAGLNIPFDTTSRIELQGVTGTADFDAQSHARPAQLQLYCWDATQLQEKASYDSAGNSYQVAPVECGGDVL